MKKTFALMLAVLMIVTLFASCAEKNGKTDETTTAETTGSSATTEALSSGNELPSSATQPSGSIDSGSIKQ